MVELIIVGSIICFLVGSFLVWWQSPRQKGKRGEKYVNKVLEQNNGTLLYDYTIVDKFGKSHQIDHLFVNKSGVFVVETKNYSGRIYGDDYSENRTQVFKYGRKKIHFYSPVKQNQTHVRNIKNVVGDEVKIFSVIVFINKNTEFIKSNFVIPLESLDSLVKAQPIIYDDESVNKILDALNKNRNTTITNKEHIKEIKDNQHKIENNICPRCGGKLVLRHGSKGEFYGCENFPKCKFTKKK